MSITRHELVTREDRLDSCRGFHLGHQNGAVDMVHEERPDTPHEDVMDPACRLQPAEQRQQPREDLERRVDVGTGAVDRQAGEDLQQEAEEQREVGQPGEWVVADEARRQAHAEQVVTQRQAETLEPHLARRDEPVPPRVLVAHEHPEKAA
jgi:hypothetical protein